MIDESYVIFVDCCFPTKGGLSHHDSGVGGKDNGENRGVYVAICSLCIYDTLL